MQKKKQKKENKTRVIKRNHVTNTVKLNLRVTFLWELDLELRTLVNHRNEFCLSALMFTDFDSRKARKDFVVKQNGGREKQFWKVVFHTIR